MPNQLSAHVKAELKAMATIVEVFDDLEGPAHERIVRWLADRYDVDFDRYGEP